MRIFFFHLLFQISQLFTVDTMTRSIYLLFLVAVIVNGTRQVTYIDNAEYTLNDSTNVLLYNITCSQCICFAFFSNNPVNYEVINCYKDNKSCLLFTNYLSQSMIRININSTLVHKQNQSSQTTNEGEYFFNRISLRCWNNI